MRAAAATTDHRPALARRPDVRPVLGPRQRGRRHRRRPRRRQRPVVQRLRPRRVRHANVQGGGGGLAPSPLKMFAIEQAVHDYLAVARARATCSSRFPNLRVASVENGAEFLPDLFRKLRVAAKKIAGLLRRGSGRDFRRHVWINPFWEDDLDEVVELMGADRVIFGSDWPHIEAPAPAARLPARARRSSTPTTSRRVLLDNASELNQPRPSVVAVADNAIAAIGLVKRFGKVVALAGVDLSVPKGTVVGLLGPNGAGKTTAVRIFTTILKPDEGRAEVLGIDVARRPGDVRPIIGLAGQYAAVDENLTGRENLRLVGRLTTSRVTSVRRAGGRAARALRPGRGRRPARAVPTRAECAAGSTSPPRWCTAHRCCSSTNRPPASTRGAATRCGRSSVSWSRRAPRCCSPPSTWRRRTGWPTASLSSTTVWSSPRERPPS